MAEKEEVVTETEEIKEETTPLVNEKPKKDVKHDRSLTLMICVLVALIATAAIAVACIYNLNNL